MKVYRCSRCFTMRTLQWDDFCDQCGADIPEDGVCVEVGEWTPNENATNARWAAFTDDELEEIVVCLTDTWMRDRHTDDRLNGPLRNEIEAEQARRQDA